MVTEEVQRRGTTESQLVPPIPPSQYLLVFTPVIMAPSSHKDSSSTKSSRAGGSVLGRWPKGDARLYPIFHDCFVFVVAHVIKHKEICCAWTWILLYIVTIVMMLDSELHLDLQSKWSGCKASYIHSENVYLHVI